MPMRHQVPGVFTPQNQKIMKTEEQLLKYLKIAEEAQSNGDLKEETRYLVAQFIVENMQPELRTFGQLKDKAKFYAFFFEMLYK